MAHMDGAQVYGIMSGVTVGVPAGLMASSSFVSAELPRRLSLIERVCEQALSTGKSVLVSGWASLDDFCVEVVDADRPGEIHFCA